MDLIDRDALYKEFRDFVRASNNSDFEPTPNWNDAVSLVGSAPTVDAVPVYMVRRMRDAQKRYFRTRDADALQESKWCEKEIDRLISDNGTVQSRLF